MCVYGNLCCVQAEVICNEIDVAKQNDLQSSSDDVRQVSLLQSNT